MGDSSYGTTILQWCSAFRCAHVPRAYKICIITIRFVCTPCTYKECNIAIRCAQQSLLECILSVLECILTGLQATSGSKQEVELAPTDSLFGEASRIAVAEACVQALQQECTDNRVYAIASVEGDGPGQDAAKWQQLFTACYPTAAKTAKSSVPA